MTLSQSGRACYDYMKALMTQVYYLNDLKKLTLNLRFLKRTQILFEDTVSKILLPPSCNIFQYFIIPDSAFPVSRLSNGTGQIQLSFDSLYTSLFLYATCVTSIQVKRASYSQQSFDQETKTYYVVMGKVSNCHIKDWGIKLLESTLSGVRVVRVQGQWFVWNIFNSEMTSIYWQFKLFCEHDDCLWFPMNDKDCINTTDSNGSKSRTIYSYSFSSLIRAA